MQKITKIDAKEFLFSQGYKIQPSVQIKDWAFEECSGIYYLPVQKSHFVNDIKEIDVLWDKDTTFIGEWDDDWLEHLELCVGGSKDTMLRFIAYCKNKDIDYEYFV